MKSQSTKAIFSTTGTELTTMASLGVLMAASSATYYQSFHYMDAGIASTILFVYPVMAAVCYGTNPFGALPLYEEGMNTSSVLFFRFSVATVILGVILAAVEE